MKERWYLRKANVCYDCEVMQRRKCPHQHRFIRVQDDEDTTGIEQRSDFQCWVTDENMDVCLDENVDADYTLLWLKNEKNARGNWVVTSSSVLLGEEIAVIRHIESRADFYKFLDIQTQDKIQDIIHNLIFSGETYYANRLQS